MKHTRIALFLILSLAASLSAFADTSRNLRTSGQALAWMRAAQGDSVYARFNAQMKSLIPAAQLTPMIAQLEIRFGPIEKTGEWFVDHIGALEIYCCDIKFSLATLRMMTAFDPDGLMSTLRFVPAPHDKPQAAPAPDTARIREQPVAITTDGYTLPATLSLPARGDRFPCVIIVHGSGPQDRDGSIGPNKVYRDIAWGLAGRGIASIRYDKRTYVYRSIPDSIEMTPDYETVDDALSAISLAASLPHIDPSRIFVAGHSFGGQMIPAIAQRSPHLAGAIILSGAARHIVTLMTEQIRYLTGGSADTSFIERQLTSLKNTAPASYWAYLDNYDTPREASRLTLPLLVIQGGRDYQVTDADFNIWRTALSSHPDATFRHYPALNHIYRSGTGLSTPDEYNRTAPVDTRLLDDIASWVSAH